ncbi:MAG: hypothetical protein ABFC96_03545 [Thermoguttaceae bacterium]
MLVQRPQRTSGDSSHVPDVATLVRKLFVARRVAMMAGMAFLGMAILAGAGGRVVWQGRWGEAIASIGITVTFEMLFIAIAGSVATCYYLFRVAYRAAGIGYALHHLFLCILLTMGAMAGVILTPLTVYYEIEAWGFLPDAEIADRLRSPGRIRDLLRFASPGWPLGLAVVLLLQVALLAYGCGCLSAFALPLSYPAIMFAWQALLLANDRNRLLVPAAIVAIVAGVVFGKNLADVVWLGQSPLLPFR